MDVGVVILNYNDYTTTLELLSKIKSYQSIKKIVVIDNCSTDDSFNVISKYITLKNIHIKLIKADKNGGYSYGNNLGLKYLVEDEKVDISIIANPDVIFEENIIYEIQDFFEKNQNSGLVSPTMLNSQNKPMRMWLTLPKYYNSLFDCFFIGRQLNKLIRKTTIHKNLAAQKVDILPGSFLAFRSSALKQINYLDENVFLFYEENIIGERMKRIGIQTFLLNNSSYIHKHSITIKKNLNIINGFKQNLKSKLYFEKEYHKIGIVKESVLRMLSQYAILEMNMILHFRKLLNL